MLIYRKVTFCSANCALAVSMQSCACRSAGYAHESALPCAHTHESASRSFWNCSRKARTVFGDEQGIGHEPSLPIVFAFCQCKYTTAAALPDNCKHMGGKSLAAAQRNQPTMGPLSSWLDLTLQYPAKTFYALAGCQQYLCLSRR